MQRHIDTQAFQVWKIQATGTGERHLGGIVVSFKRNELSSGFRTGLCEQTRQGQTGPREDGRSAFHTAKAIDTFLNRGDWRGRAR